MKGGSKTGTKISDKIIEARTFIIPIKFSVEDVLVLYEINVHARSRFSADKKWEKGVRAAGNITPLLIIPGLYLSRSVRYFRGGKQKKIKDEVVKSASVTSLLRVNFYETQVPLN